MHNPKSFDAKWNRLLEATGAKTDTALGKALGILPQSVTAARRRRQIPGGWIEKISEKHNVDASWLLFGTGCARSVQDETRKNAGTGDAEAAQADVPVIGLAACGLSGWYNPGPLAIRAPLPAGVVSAGGLFAVLAVGVSMQPDGIRPGHVLFCDPACTPLEDDAVFIEKNDGTASVKRFKGRDGAWVVLQGWLDPDASGVQKPYTERLALASVVRMASVIIVRRKA